METFNRVTQRFVVNSRVMKRTDNIDERVGAVCSLTIQKNYVQLVFKLTYSQLNEIKLPLHNDMQTCNGMHIKKVVIHY